MLLIFLKTIGIFLMIIILILIIFGIIKGRGAPVKLSPTKNENKPNESFSIREKININDSEQYVFITSENKKNPVLLFLHGGPGSPEVSMHSFKFDERLEKRFTVCYWEQRGAGLSYNARLSPEKMTLDVMINDTIAITEHLLKRFGKEQIYIMGHSWGSFLGVKVIQRKPEYYKAYFGIGQISHQKKSELLAYDHMINYAKSINDTKAVKSLNNFDPDSADFPSNKYMVSTRTKYMNKYGIGVKHEKNFRMTKLLLDILLFPGYSLLDFVKFGLGSSFSMNLNAIYLNENLMETSIDIEVPVYIMHGRYDHQVSYDLAKKYLDKIQATNKAFYSFENSAHSPNFEETDKFLAIVFSLLDKHENYC